MNKKLTEMVLLALGLALVMAVTVWFTGGVMRLILLAALYFVEMEILAYIQRIVLNEPEKAKMTKEEQIKAEDQWYFERQEYGKMYDMRRVGTAMNVIAIVLVLPALFRGAANPLWGILGMGCCLVSVALCIIYPAYFALFHGEKEKNRQHKFPIVNLIVPYVFPLFASAWSYEMAIGVTDWVRAAEAALLVGAVIGAVLRFLAAECRRNTGNWVVALLGICICASGFVIPLNQILEKTEPQIVSGVVADYNRGSRGSPGAYEVLLDSGEEARIPVDRRFHDYDKGDEIELEYHRGGLGIEYYTYAD